MKSILITFGLIGLTAQHALAATVFSDTFEYSGTPAAEANLATNAAARQAAGLTSSGYSPQEVGPAANGAFLNAHGASGDDVLLLRTINPAGGASQTAVDLNTNFASQLAGQSYTISLSDVSLSRNAANISDAWLALSIGDTASSITGPNNALADASMLIRARSTNNVTRWQDGSSAGALTTTGLTVDYGYGPNRHYSEIQLRIDELAGTAQGYFRDTAGNEFTSATWAIDFENSTDRYIELRAHQGAAGTDGALMDARVNTITITTIPEPSTTALAGLGIFTFICRRKRRRGSAIS